jgi:hypothetical protein
MNWSVGRKAGHYGASYLVLPMRLALDRFSGAESAIGVGDSTFPRMDFGNNAILSNIFCPRLEKEHEKLYSNNRFYDG